MNNPINNLPPLKIYPKTYEDFWDINEKVSGLNKNASLADYSVSDFVKLSRDFYNESNSVMFDFFVKQTWLMFQVKYKGRRILSFRKNGIQKDSTRARFFKYIVGKTGRVVTSTYGFSAVISYFPDLFPDFLKDDPFKNPEKYKFPYKHVTMEFMEFVAEIHCRHQMLEEAEKRGMSIVEFMNWVINWIFCYNDEVGKEVYRLGMRHNAQLTIKDNRLPNKWSVPKFKFNE